MDSLDSVTTTRITSLQASTPERCVWWSGVRVSSVIFISVWQTKPLISNPFFHLLLLLPSALVDYVMSCSGKLEEMLKCCTGNPKKRGSVTKFWHVPLLPLSKRSRQGIINEVLRSSSSTSSSSSYTHTHTHTHTHKYK